jgi:rfaE bifunctional protein nucleotidyltransferase chain/domain
VSKLVLTSGCFDIFHDAHVNLLRACHEIGDTVVVFLNSDSSISRIKGEGRPVMPLAVRLSVLHSIKYVDSIVVFDDDTPAIALRNYREKSGDTRTFFWVKGADARITGLPDVERDAVIETGGIILFYDNPSNTHSSEIRGHLTGSQIVRPETKVILDEVD